MSTPLDIAAANSSRAITAIITATVALAEATAHEDTLELERPAVKLGAIQAIMASGPNPLNDKPHSASSAEAIVETDATYRAYRIAQSEAVTDRIAARGAYEATLRSADRANLLLDAAVRAEGRGA